MKLLLITDRLSVLRLFQSQNDKYYYHSIQIDFIYLTGEEDFSLIRHLLSGNRYHLILAVLKGKFTHQYLSGNQWIHSVNNYADESVKTRIREQLEEHHSLYQPSIVNKTTIYFNVFLSFPKGVSMTGNEADFNLPRLDVISGFNYMLAALFFINRGNYYILNYPEDLSISDLEALLNKLD